MLFNSIQVIFYLGDEDFPYIIGEPEDPKDKQEHHPPDYPEEEPLEEYKKEVFVLAEVDIGRQRIMSNTNHQRTIFLMKLQSSHITQI